MHELKGISVRPCSVHRLICTSANTVYDQTDAHIDVHARTNTQRSTRMYVHSLACELVRSFSRSLTSLSHSLTHSLTTLRVSYPAAAIPELTSASPICFMFASFTSFSCVNSPHECHIIGGYGASSAEDRRDWTRAVATAPHDGKHAMAANITTGVGPNMARILRVLEL